MHLLSLHGNFAEKHSFHRVFGNRPKLSGNLRVFTKFPQLEIRWNIGSLRSDYYIILHGIRDLQLLTRVRRLNQKLSEKAARWFYRKVISTILLASCLKKYQYIIRAVESFLLKLTLDTFLYENNCIYNS